eukprot:gnl/MRDRNA2_/MRDRNA2_92823_c0_seq1.p1 gnl/MRDRNA2_/MRDRNA2_92823_c0~~gnl/MRDRNA2_/MRDRNA2_92823_c0_seq1.p1  ORF type:complete len:1064 (+),score=201.78 gnl/MRDRNA2_/MRDRNA2_92823_c0_seq1:226-3417(+)
MVVLRPPKLDSYFSMRPTLSKKDPVQDFSDIRGGPEAERKGRIQRALARKKAAVSVQTEAAKKNVASKPEVKPEVDAVKKDSKPETKEFKGFLDRRQRAAMDCAEKALTLQKKSPVTMYLVETEAAAEALSSSKKETATVNLTSSQNAQQVFQSLGALAKQALNSRSRTNRQAKIVAEQSTGRLLDSTYEYNTGIPGQKASAEACLPPPLDDVLALLPEEGRPKPQEIIDYMKLRKLRPREATAELILLGQCNSNIFFAGLQDLIDNQEKERPKEGPRQQIRSPLVAETDSETLELTIGDWVKNLREEIVQAKLAQEEPQDEKGRGVKRSKSKFWTNPNLFKTTEKRSLSKKQEAEEILDIRWFCAAVLCFPKVVQASFGGYAVGEGLSALGVWSNLQVLNFSNSVALHEDSFSFLANRCRLLNWLEVTRCPRLLKMEALKDCLKLKTVIAHDCVGLKCDNTSDILMSSKTVDFVELRGSTSLVTARLVMPVLPSLDLRFLPSLQRLSGTLPALTVLNLSKCAELKTFDHFMFKVCPNLQDFTCRGCPMLESITGMESAKHLKVIRANHCPKLVSLGVDRALENETERDVFEGKTVFGHVRYIDLNGNTSISDTEIWKFIRNTWSSSSLQETEILKRASQVPPIRKRAGHDEVTLMDHTDHTKLVTNQSHTKMNNFEIVYHIEAVMAGDGTSSAGYSFVCWPSTERRENFGKKLSVQERKHLDLVALGGVQDKFRDANSASEVAYIEVTQGSRQPIVESTNKEEAKKIRKVRLAPKELRDLAKNELQEAVEMLQDRDLDLLRTGLVELTRVLPDQIIPCCNTGCDLKKPVKDVQAHMNKDCQGRLVKCEQGCGKWVKVCYKEHHEQIEARLEKALSTWNLPNLKNAVNEALTHCCAPECRWKKVCTGCKLPEQYMRHAEDKLKQLEINCRRVSPVIAKGNISIDFDNCTVDIKGDIKFEARKPPDHSASFDDRAAAVEIIADLATVINAFETPMIIEGHTGQKEPADYWGKLAMNRAALICRELATLGVNPSLARARGCPGGGAKVLIIPARVPKGSQASANL